jgi:hypothetical protein
LLLIANPDSWLAGDIRQEGKAVANKKFVVELSVEERALLSNLISKGKSPAKTILKARILLEADRSEAAAAGRTGRSARRSTPTSAW